MNKRLLTLFTACLLSGLAMAQTPSLRPSSPTSSLFILQDTSPADTTWKRGGAFGFNFNQTYLNNWAAGGQSAFALSGLFNYFTNYAKNRLIWDNNLDVAFGMLSPDFKNTIKIDDRLELTSKAGLRMVKKPKWFYSALFNFRSQLATGFPVESGLEVKQIDRRLSAPFAPAYFTFALGAEYKPNANFYVLIAPASWKGTMVNDQDLADNGAYGVDAATYDDLGERLTAGSKFRSEIGGTIQAVYKKALAENISFQTSLNLFSNYAEKPQNVDVNWQNLLAVKLGKSWNINVSTALLYDDDVTLFKEAAKVNDDGTVTAADIGPGVQFKETFALGFGYQF